MDINACGFFCQDCPMIGNTCQGCGATLGKPPWVYEANFAGGCPIYNCAIGQKGYSHCGQCPELPCGMFSSLKDPNMSDEAFRQGLAERIARLKGAEIRAGLLE